MIVIQYDNEEAMMDALLDAEIELNDIEIEEGYMTITVDPTQLDDAKVVVEKLIPDVKFQVLEDKMIPNEEVELHGEDLTLFKRLSNFTIYLKWMMYKMYIISI